MESTGRSVQWSREALTLRFTIRAAGLRALRREVFQFLKSGRALMFAFIAPPLVVLLVGQLNVRPQGVRVAVTGVAPGDDGNQGRSLVEVLRQLPGVTAASMPARPPDPLRFLGDAGYDLAVVVNDLGADQWGIYTAETEPSRTAGIRRLALVIEQWRLAQTKKSGESKAGEPKDPTGPPEKKKGSALQSIKVEDLRALGILPPTLLFSYVPDAGERSAGFLPMSIALLICFFPFVMAAPSLVQEVEVNTVGTTLCAPGLTHNSWFAAKFLLPVLIACVDALIMFACAEGFYQLHIKPGAVVLGSCVLLAASAAAFLGLAISSVVKSSSQAGGATALYFLGLLMLSGFFIPLDQSGAIVRAVAMFLPLAPLDHAVKVWLFGGNLATLAPQLWQLGKQVLLDGILALLCYRFIFVPRL